ncbi:hypothetical protein MKW94_012249 [Papaver nudicaule]|uniref:Uncharacterized protein n=1 Tax=Papaver nudicaule TaxID=74823 RepID=A0AA42B489_PAPNU|nr:hypothetical protein [Papaver nudicaule]
MAKISFIFSPLLFGLFSLVLIALCETGGVNGFTQPICPASAPKSLGYKNMISWNDCFENCRYWCIAAYGSTWGPGAVPGYCFNPRLFVIVCQCCTANITTTHVSN